MAETKTSKALEFGKSLGQSVLAGVVTAGVIEGGRLIYRAITKKGSQKKRSHSKKPARARAH